MILTIKIIGIIVLIIGIVILLFIVNNKAYQRGFLHGGLFADIKANAELVGHKKQEQELINSTIAQLALSSDDDENEKH